MALERGEDAAGMYRERPYAGVARQRIEVQREQRVGRLGLPVGRPLVVSVLELHVVPADRRAPVPERGQRDDPGATVVRESRPQQVREHVVTQMVGRELGLPTRSDA